MLARFESGGQVFLSRIVTAEETSIRHFEPKTKMQSMEWHHPQSPEKKNSKGLLQAARPGSLSSGTVKE
jgi:hypothetical protein